MNEWNIETTISLILPDYQVIADSIMPDLVGEGSRTSITCNSDGKRFYIYIRASDNVALRAALGTVTRQLITAHNVNKEVK